MLPIAETSERRSGHRVPAGRLLGIQHGQRFLHFDFAIRTQSVPWRRSMVVAVAIGRHACIRGRPAIVSGTTVSAVSRSADGPQLGPLFAREIECRDDFRLLQGLCPPTLQGDLPEAGELRGR